MPAKVNRLFPAACGLMLSLLAVGDAIAGEWPQILGPNRNGIAAEDEVLADEWPTEGPYTLWQREVGSGYAGVAVANKRVVLFHRVENKETIEALDAATGKTQWTHAYVTSFAPQVGSGDGPLCVPVIQGNRVYTYGAQGVLTCCDAATGQEIWQRDTHADFGAQPGYFGAGSTPIVVGDIVVVNVGGGQKEAGIVGFSAANGKTLWTQTSERASYSAPVLFKLNDINHLLMVTRYTVVLLDPATGAVRWQFSFGARGPTVNAATPLVLKGKGNADHLLVTSSYGVGTIYGSFDRTRMMKVWGGTDSLASQYCTPIALGGFLYAFDGRDDQPPAELKCIKQLDGEVMWTEGIGYGTLLFADGKLIASKTDGELMLIKPDAASLHVLAQARPFPPGPVRALPALAGGKLYLRDEHTLKCLNVKPKVR